VVVINLDRKDHCISVRIIVLAVILTCSLFTLPAGAQTDDASYNRKILTAVILMDSPPLDFQDPKTQKAAGFTVDIMDEIAGRAGFSVSYRFEKDWAASIDAVRTGKADIAPIMGITEERQKVLAFTSPVVTLPLVIVARSDDKAISGLRKGLRVGAIKGSVAYELIKKNHDDVALKTFENYSDGLFNLLAGNIDAFCCAASTLIQLAREAGVEDRVKIVGAPLMEFTLGMALRKDDTQLLSKLNAIMAGFIGSPDYQRIYMKWFGKPKPFLAVSKNTLLTTVLVFFAVAVMALWRHRSVMSLARRLTSEIAERKKTERALRESEESYRILFDQDPLPGWIYDTETFKFLLVNNAAQRDYGYSMEEFLAMTIKNIRPAEDLDKLISFSSEITGKPAVSGFWRHRKKDGSLIHVEINSHPVVFNEKKARRVIVKDITERILAEEELKISRQRLALHIQLTPLAVIEFDISGQVREWNPAATAIFGFSHSEAVGQYWTFMVPESAWNNLDGVWAALVARRGGSRSTNENITKSGNIISCEWFNTPLVDPNGKAIGVASLVMDVTEPKQAEEKLRKRERQLAESQRVGRIGSWSWDVENNALDWSEETFRRFDKDPRSFIPTVEYYVSRIHPDDQPAIQRSIQASLENDAPYHIQPRIRNENGREWVLEGFGFVERDANGKPLRFSGTAQDITERKHTEELVLRSLKEKDVMLKEIHHRVKNNMQVIYSLLNLKAKSVADSEIRGILEESRDRVHSMSLIHETLYRSDDLAHVDFKTYLQCLVQNISSSYKRHDVQIRVDMEPVALDVNTGIPCGLIANELVSNSLKHAFPEGKQGTINVGIRTDGLGSNVLFVEDNGIGLPADLDFRNTASLGLQLATVLAGQIHGMIELSRTEGTKFSITFPGA